MTELDSVDNILCGQAVSLIKMDVEGMEAEAIAGMERTLRRWRPRLLVSAYHRSEDLWRLPLAVLALRARESAPAGERPRLRHAVQAGGPMILPLLLLVVATLVVDHARYWALAGFVAAILGFGLRSMLLQIALLERQAALDALARLDGLTGVANRRQFDAVLQLSTQVYQVR